MLYRCLAANALARVGAGDIEAFVRDVANGKTAKDVKIAPRKRIIVRGGPGAARKVVRDLSAVYSFAIRRELVERNPVERAAVRKTDNQRERYLSLEEVSQLGKAFDKILADGANRKAIDIARLWALTGCRRNEIAALEWDEVDLDRGLLVLGDTKTGRSIRPLSLAAMAHFKRDHAQRFVQICLSSNQWGRLLSGYKKHLAEGEERSRPIGCYTAHLAPYDRIDVSISRRSSCTDGCHSRA